MAESAQPGHNRGEVFLDARGNGRAMRLSWHPQADMVVLSLWRDQTCVGTFRMSHADVGAFIDTLIDGLRDAPGVHLPARDAVPVVAPRDVPVEPDVAAAADTAVMTAPDQSQAFADWAFASREEEDRAKAN